MGRFVLIAMGSASELDYHLLLAKDLGMLNPWRYSEQLERDLVRIRQMLTSFLTKLRANSQKPVATGDADGDYN